MKLIDELLLATPCRRLELLRTLIRLNKYMTINKIREIDKRNARRIKEDIINFISMGIIYETEKAVITGRNKARINRIHYKINKSSVLVKKLWKEL